MTKDPTTRAFEAMDRAAASALPAQVGDKELKQYESLETLDFFSLMQQLGRDETIRYIRDMEVRKVKNANS